MLKPNKILKIYGISTVQEKRMQEEILSELKTLDELLKFPSQLSEQLPLPLYNNLLREDQPRLTGLEKEREE